MDLDVYGESRLGYNKPVPSQSNAAPLPSHETLQRKPESLHAARLQIASSVLNAELQTARADSSPKLPSTSLTTPSIVEDAFDVVLGYRRLRVNSIDILHRCQILGGRKSQMEIPLCRMIGLQVVRSALAIDIEKMKADFIHGYHPGAVVFYVSTTNIQGNLRDVTNDDRLSWNCH